MTPVAFRSLPGAYDAWPDSAVQVRQVAGALRPSDMGDTTTSLRCGWCRLLHTDALCGLYDLGCTDTS